LITALLAVGAALLGGRLFLLQGLLAEKNIRLVWKNLIDWQEKGIL